jgi:adenylylsulfate reductase subunit A
MAAPNTHTVECDILIIGGGMSGCGAAFEAKYWGQDLRVVLVDKAVIERSGATGEGLSAINCYLGQRYGWNSLPYTFFLLNGDMELHRNSHIFI